MGVEYKHFLIPRDNSLHPTAEQLHQFIQRLIDERWLCNPTAKQHEDLPFEVMSTYPNTSTVDVFIEIEQGDLRVESPFTVELLNQYQDRELKINWIIEDLSASALKYPLTPLQNMPKDTYYQFQIHLGIDYIYHCSEIIQPFQDVNCKCGASMEYEAVLGPFYNGTNLRYFCLDCGRKFDVSKLDAIICDFKTAKKRKVLGGAAYRFAIVIDCGKCFPSEDDKISIQPQLRSLCESFFQGPFYQLGDI